MSFHKFLLLWQLSLSQVGYFDYITWAEWCQDFVCMKALFLFFILWWGESNAILCSATRNCEKMHIYAISWYAKHSAILWRFPKCIYNAISWYTSRNGERNVPRACPWNPPPSALCFARRVRGIKYKLNLSPDAHIRDASGCLHLLHEWTFT